MHDGQRAALEALKAKADQRRDDEKPEREAKLPADAKPLGIGMVGGSHESRVLWCTDVRRDTRDRPVGDPEWSTDLDGEDVQPINGRSWEVQVRA